MVAAALPALAAKTNQRKSSPSGTAAVADERNHYGSSAAGSCGIWKAVPGWPSYEVSAYGHVRRIGHAKGASVGRVLIQLLNRKTGYLSVHLSEHSIRKRIDVHRLVVLAFLEPQPSARHLVAHNDGSRTNNVVTNLRWATQTENLRDCLQHGTVLLGSRNPMATVTEIDVRAIRRMKAFGIPRAVIAEGYGIHLRSVFRILSGTNWGHVQ